MLDLTGRAKWDAWNGNRGKSTLDAMQEYTHLVQSLSSGSNYAGSDGSGGVLAASSGANSNYGRGAGAQNGSGHAMAADPEAQAQVTLWLKHASEFGVPAPEGIPEPPDDFTCREGYLALVDKPLANLLPRHLKPVRFPLHTHGGLTVGFCFC